MNDRRRFLHVLGATTAAVALPACGGSGSTDGTTGTGAGGAGAGGGGGAGGAGASTSGEGGAGGGSASSTADASSTSAASSSASTGGGNCEMNPAGSAIGVPADFATDGLHMLPGTKVLVGRDSKGLYALTSICPHEFCDMDEKKGGQPEGTINGNGITCNCHGSKFDVYGAVTKGPANKPLKAYAMALGCDGKIYVDKTSVVPVTQRLDA